MDTALAKAETILAIASVLIRYGNRTTAAIRSLRAEIQSPRP
jgi:hypothetical protein